MRLDPLAHGGATKRPSRGLLVWSAATLLAAALLALAMVLAGLALESRSEPTPSPKPPIEIAPPAGRPMPQ